MSSIIHRMATSLHLPTESNTDRIDKALSIAVAYGGVDGAHHKDWVIDQMVRALTGCPVNAEGQGESPAYQTLVAAAKAGEDGPETYSWDTGIAP